MHLMSLNVEVTLTILMMVHYAAIQITPTHIFLNLFYSLQSWVDYFLCGFQICHPQSPKIGAWGFLFISAHDHHMGFPYLILCSFLFRLCSSPDHSRSPEILIHLQMKEGWKHLTFSAKKLEWLWHFQKPYSQIPATSASGHSPLPPTMLSMM